MGSALVYSLDSSGSKLESNSLLELGDVDALLLEVRVLPHHTGRVELGSTSPVGVASSHH